MSENSRGLSGVFTGKSVLATEGLKEHLDIGKKQAKKYRTPKLYQKNVKTSAFYWIISAFKDLSLQQRREGTFFIC